MYNINIIFVSIFVFTILLFNDIFIKQHTSIALPSTTESKPSLKALNCFSTDEFNI